MKISVIIPTYKPKAYIWECLDSLVKQDFPKKDFEVIIILNGCRDPYETDIRTYIKEHTNTNFVYLQTNVGGVSNARNLGIEVANGKYITFIDDDDYVSDHYLSGLYKYSGVHTVSVSDNVSFDDVTKEEENNILHQAYTKLKFDASYSIMESKRFYGCPVRKLIHRDIIGNRRFDVRYRNAEDTLFMFLISDKIAFTTKGDSGAIYYRRCRSNSAHFAKRNRLESFKLGLSLINTYFVIYLKNPLKYNFVFFITRVVSALKMALI